MKTQVEEIVKSIIKGYGKTHIVRSNDNEICVSMDEPSLGDSQMDELVGKLKEAAPEGVTVEEEEGALVSLTW